MLLMMIELGRPSPIHGLMERDALLLRKETHYAMAGARFLPLTIDDCTIHLHLHKCDVSVKGGSFILRNIPW